MVIVFLRCEIYAEKLCQNRQQLWIRGKIRLLAYVPCSVVPSTNRWIYWRAFHESSIYWSYLHSPENYNSIPFRLLIFLDCYHRIRMDSTQKYQQYKANPDSLHIRGNKSGTRKTRIGPIWKWIFVDATQALQVYILQWQKLWQNKSKTVKHWRATFRLAALDNSIAHNEWVERI